MPYPGLGANLEVATFPGCLPIWRRLLGEIRAPYRGKPVLRTESERLLSSMGASISPNSRIVQDRRPGDLGRLENSLDEG